MKATALVLAALVFSLSARAETSFKPSGRAKVFKGPEGEIVTFVPLDENTKALILAQNTYGSANEKPYVYDLQKYPQANATVGFPQPGSHGDGRAMVVVMNRRDEQWTYFDALTAHTVVDVKLSYSDELSQKADVAKLVKKAELFDPSSQL